MPICLSFVSSPTSLCNVGMTDEGARALAWGLRLNTTLKRLESVWASWHMGTTAHCSLLRLSRAKFPGYGLVALANAIRDNASTTLEFLG